MVRSLAFGIALLVVVAAVLYGVVLNGFGMFGPDEDRRVAASPPPPAVAPPGPAPVSNPEPPPDPVVVPEPAAAPPPDPAPVPLPAAPGSAQPDDFLPAPERVARNVTPPNVLQRPTSRYVEPGSEPAPEPEPVRPRRYHRVVVADAGTLKAGDTVIRLAGIAPVPAEQTCTDAAGRDWPCGRAAVAALRMLIRNRAIDCSQTAALDDGIAATCSVGLQDINGWLVSHGWAEPDADDYAEAAESARREQRGVHATEWRAGGAMPSGAAGLSAFTAPDLPPERVPGLPAASPALPDTAPSVAPPAGPVELAPPPAQ